jgi:hypothetical protein
MTPAWLRILFCLLPVASLAACYTIEEPPCPPIEIPENTGECSEFCQCDYDEFANTPFRLTRLEIDEPEELASLLNLMWSTDIRNNVVNVVLLVKSFEKGTAAAFDSITFQVGPGWRDPAEELSVPPAAGEPSQSVINSYCMLEGMDVEMSVEPYHGNQCVFKSTAASALNFHSGPLGGPIICAPELNPANSIPIKGMKTRFGLNEDCRGFADGHLEGCIAVKDADMICMCLATGTCTMEPVDVGEYEPDDLSSYCKDVCGLKWVSLGQSMRAFGLKPTCLTQDNEPGYRIQGFIDGEAVPDHFNPVQSGDCTQY